MSQLEYYCTVIIINLLYIDLIISAFSCIDFNIFT